MSEKQNLATPVAIVIGAAIIGAAIFFVEKDRPIAPLPSPSANAPVVATISKDAPAVTAADHIQGGTGAPVTVVEYMDFECPFCKQFDGTMQQVIAAYPGKLAWVTRNFPLQSLHPNAPKLALAAECVADLAGNDAYWKFKDAIFAAAPATTTCTPLGNGCSYFDISKLDATAASAGVSDTGAFDRCVSSGKYQNLVTQEYNDAMAAGGQGTPYSVIVLKSPMSASVKAALTKIQGTLPQGSLLISADGTQVGMSGSQPIDVVKSILDAILNG